MNLTLRSLFFLLLLVLLGFESFSQVHVEQMIVQHVTKQSALNETSSQKWKKHLSDNFFLSNDHQRINHFNGNTSPSGRQLEFYPDTIIIYSLGNDPQRFTYLYSNSGNLLITIVKEYTNGGWTNAAMENNNYDNNGNKLGSIWQTWISGSWTNSLKTTYTYVNNQLETTTTQIWSAGQWVNHTKVTNSYNGAMKLASVFTEMWVAGAWTNESFELYQYDDNNNLLNLTGQVWNAVYWINDYWLEYTYNTYNKMSSAEFRQWTADAWLNTYREEYIYDDQLNITHYTGKIWLGNGWIFSDKFTYTYTPTGWVETATKQSWQNNQWTNDQKTTFNYHGYGGILYEIEQEWVAGQWVNDGLTNCNYNEDGNAGQCNYYNWNGDTWEQNENAVLELNYSNGAKTKILSGYKATASYISFLVGQREAVENDLMTISPNPASGFLHLTINNTSKVEWKIYNVKGQLALEGILIDSFKTISIDMLPKGLYVLSSTDGHKSSNLKFIKK